MQKSRSRKQPVESESSPSSIPNSPYRMGNWTVTMLKEELRAKQLPITGKKAELIDRLENSPIKTSAAPNIVKSSPLKVSNMNAVLQIPASPSASVKSVVSNFINEASPLARGRSRSQSPSHRMLTRSRSTSLSRGTFLTWSRAPLSVIGNFLMAQLDGVRENAAFFGALTAFFVALVALLYSNAQYRTIFYEQLTRAQPVLQTLLDGFSSSLGFSRSDFCAYISKAARFIYDCSSGNIERNSSTGRLRCSAAPLKSLDFGLPGRLFWLTREQFVAWSVGTLFASTLIYFVSRKCRTALPLQSNKNVLNILKFATKLVFPAAALLPFEVSGLISGLSDFSGKQFILVLAVKAFIGIPFQFANSILFSKFQKSIEKALLSHLNFSFNINSVHLLWARQAANAALYVLICAAAIQVIANSRLYYKNYGNNVRR